MKEPPSKAIALWCWYHGGPFRGYQSQPKGPTVQDVLIAALRDAGFSRNPVPSGRTDLGVHARMQVLGMRIVENVEPPEVANRLNAQLAVTSLNRWMHSSASIALSGEPERTVAPLVAGNHLGIAVSCEAPHKFHPQWRSQLKEYRYRILLADDPQWAPYAWRTDVDPMRAQEYLRLAEGTHDFYAFHDKSSTQMPRTLTSTQVVQLMPHLWEFRVQGPGFARYMVRYLVGAAVSLALGQIHVDDYLRALNEAVPMNGFKAPAQGLILWRVAYPKEMDPFGGASPVLPQAPPFFDPRGTFE